MTQSRSNMHETTQRLIGELRRDKKKTGLLVALVLVGVVIAIKTLPSSSPPPAKADGTSDSVKAKAVPGCEDPRLLEKKHQKEEYIRAIDTHVTRDVFLPDEKYFPIPKPVEPAKVMTTTTSAPAVDQQALLERQVLTEAKDLQLESTMLGGHSVASINGKVLSAGETINGFKLTVIASNRCTLVKDGVTVLLQIHE